MTTSPAADTHPTNSIAVSIETPESSVAAAAKAAEKEAKKAAEKEAKKAAKAAKKAEAHAAQQAAAVAMAAEEEAEKAAKAAKAAEAHAAQQAAAVAKAAEEEAEKAANAAMKAAEALAAQQAAAVAKAAQAAQAAAEKTATRAAAEANEIMILFDGVSALGLGLVQLGDSVGISSVAPTSAAAAVPLFSKITAINGKSCAGNSKGEVVAAIGKAKAAGAFTMAFAPPETDKMAVEGEAKAAEKEAEKAAKAAMAAEALAAQQAAAVAKAAEEEAERAAKEEAEKAAKAAKAAEALAAQQAAAEAKAAQAAQAAAEEAATRAAAEANEIKILFDGASALGLGLLQQEDSVVISSVAPTSAAAAVPLYSKITAINGKSCAGNSKGEVVAAIGKAKAAGAFTVAFAPPEEEMI